MRAVPVSLAPFIDAGLLLSLLAAGALMRLPLADALPLNSDHLDPLSGALTVLATGNPFAGGHPIFAYGRELSALPLVLGAGDLLDVAVRRAWLSALAAPLTALAAAWAIGWPRPGARLAAVAAGALVALHPAIQQALTGAYQGYYSVEWGAGAALGLAMLARGTRGGAVVAGISLAMAVSSSPYSLALLAPLGLLLLRARGEDDRARRGAVLGAALIAVALLVPHLVRVAGLPPDAVDGQGANLLSAARSRGSLAGVGLVGTVRAYTVATGPGALGALLLFAPLLAAVIGKARDLGPLVDLGKGALAGSLLGLGLSLLVNHSMPWHWLPLLPLHAVCLGAVAGGALRAERGPAFAALAAGLAIAPVLGFGLAQERAEPNDEQLMQVRGLDRVAPRWSGEPLIGYQLVTDDWEPTAGQWFPLLLNGAMGEAPDAAQRPEDPVFLYLEGSPDSLARLADQGLPAGATLRAATLSVVLPGPAALAFGQRLCAGPWRLALIESADRAAVPRHEPAEPSRFVPPCALAPEDRKRSHGQGLHPDAQRVVEPPR